MRTQHTAHSAHEEAVAIRREASKVEDAAYYAENLLRSLARLDPELLVDALNNVNGDTPDAAEMVGRLGKALSGIVGMQDDIEPIIELGPAYCGRCGREYLLPEQHASRPDRCRCGENGQWA